MGSAYRGGPVDGTLDAPLSVGVRYQEVLSNRYVRTQSGSLQAAPVDGAPDVTAVTFVTWLDATPDRPRRTPGARSRTGSTTSSRRSTPRPDRAAPPPGRKRGGPARGHARLGCCPSAGRQFGFASAFASFGAKGSQRHCTPMVAIQA